MKPLLIMLCLAGCQAPAPLPEPPPAPVVVIERTPVAVPSLLPRVASVANAYDVVARREASAVTAPDVTAGYVRAVHAADLQARAALTILARMKLHPTAAALANARAAVGALEDALNGS